MRRGPTWPLSQLPTTCKRDADLTYRTPNKSILACSLRQQ